MLHRSRISAVTLGFAKDLTGCFSHCCAEGGDHWIQVCIFIVHDGERYKLHAYHSLEGFQHIGIFQAFRGQTWVLCVLACWFFSGEGGRSSSASRGHFHCLLLENNVLWQCSLLIRSASSLEFNQSGCGVVHWAMPGPSSGCFLMTKSVRQHKIVKGGKLQKSETPLICVIISEGSTNALPVSTSIPADFCIPVSLYNKNVFLRCLINDIL